MSRRPLSLVATVIFFAGSVVSAEAVTTIAIDGVQAGAIVSWEGGDPRASVVPGSTATDGTVKKQPGAVVYAPLVVTSVFLPAEPLRNWLGELCADQTPRRKIVLTDYDATGRATGATEFDGAMLAEVRLPVLDATSPTVGNIAFVFAVESSRNVVPAASTSGAAARATSANFRLSIDGLDGTGVIGIEPIAVVRGEAAAGAPGAIRDYAATAGAVGFSNLVVTLARAKSATWRAWFTDFVINGNGSDANEKSGALEFLAADLKQTAFALRFQNMGILRVSRVSAATGAPELVQAELYFEKLSTGAASTSGGSDSSTQAGSEETEQSTSGASEGEGTAPEESSGAGESTGGDGETALDGAQDSSGSTGADTSGTAALNPGNRFISSDATVPDSTTTATRADTLIGANSITTTSTTNPADQGTRDPAEFPRVEGLTRVDFSGQYGETSSVEESHYTTSDNIYDLVARIDAAANNAGWTQTLFREGYSNGEKWVTEQWTKDSSSVALEINQPDSGITRYWIRVIVQKPATN